jgi:hypothetical protein
MTNLQVEFQKAQETARTNRVNEAIRNEQALAARKTAEAKAAEQAYRERLEGFEKFNKVASGIGAIGKGVGSILNPGASLLNTGMRNANELAIAAME